MKIYKFILIVSFLLSLAPALTYALPDLSVSNITFSNNNPEPTEVVTISATIHNTGDDYLLLHSEPFESHDYIVGTTSTGAHLFNITWLAQYFTASEDIYLGRVSVRIRNYKSETDSITMEIRNDDGSLKPVSGSNNFLASKTLIDGETTYYHWQDFDFSTPPFLTKGSTYWICLENLETSASGGYIWWVDTGTIVNTLAASINQGASWGPADGDYKAYFRTYESSGTLVTFCEGNPATGGVLISTVSLTTPVPGGGNSVVSSTWSALSEDSYDIYVAVDYPDFIDEESEVNNISSKTVTAIAKTPQILNVFPPQDSKGIEPKFDFAVEVMFSKKMDETKVEEAISLTAIKDNKGNSISAETGFVLGTTVYADKVLTFAPDPELPKGYTYIVKVSTHAEDLFLNNLPEEKIWRFTTVMDHTKTNIFKADDELTEVEVSSGVLEDSDYYIEIDTAVAVSITRANDKIKRIRNMFSYPLDNTLCEFTLYKGAWQGIKSTATFSAPVRITMPYSGLEKKGMISQDNSPPIKESKLSIFYLNEEDNLWVKIPGSLVNTTSNTVTAYVNHFSIYTIMGISDADLSKVHAYPVPWKPFDGKDKTGTLQDGITFTELGSEATIRIYNISGELVEVLDYNYSIDGEQKEWKDVTNRGGEPLASGLYIYYIENEKEHKSGKLIIVR